MGDASPRWGLAAAVRARPSPLHIKKALASKGFNKRDASAVQGPGGVFVRHSGTQWIEEGPWEVNEHSLGRLLSWLTGLASGKALTAENLYALFNGRAIPT